MPAEAKGPVSRSYRIKFTEDWDKLRHPYFTTIRSYRADKERYYRGLLGRTFTVLQVKNYWSNIGRKIGDATLLKVRVTSPKNLPVQVLVDDVTIGGHIDETWMRRLLEMDLAVVLDFGNHTEDWKLRQVGRRGQRSPFGGARASPSG